MLINIHVLLAQLGVQNSNDSPKDTRLSLTFAIPATHVVHQSQYGFSTFTWRANHKLQQVLKNFLQDFFFFGITISAFDLKYKAKSQTFPKGDGPRPHKHFNCIFY